VVWLPGYGGGLWFVGFALEEEGWEEDWRRVEEGRCGGFVVWGLEEGAC
jgi:hypothetical protein